MVRARHLLKSSAIVIVLLALGKVTGLLRTRLVSAAFGTGMEFDAFTAANQLPELFVTLISGGALAAAFIPVYSAHLSGKATDQSAKLVNSILTLVVAALGGISLLGIAFAPWITEYILVPDFSPELQHLTATLMRVILVQTTLFGVSGVLSSILNAHQHFALPALAPVMLDVGYLLGLYFLVPSIGIHGLAWGTVLGGILHILVQTPALRRYSIGYIPELAIQMSGVKEIVMLMGPRIITLGTVQFADLIIIRLTSGLPSGSTSSYFYGYYLMQLPETLFGTAIALVVFPTMSELYNAGDISGLKSTAISALRIIWTLTIPAAVALVLLGEPAIRLFLQQGAFTEASTRMVYGVLLFFSFRILSEASLEIFARLFYAQHDTLTPMIVAVIWLIINICLAYVLKTPLGVQGLALSSTIAFTVQVIILYLISRRRLGYLHENELIQSAFRSLVGATLMALVIVGINQFVKHDFFILILGGFFGLITFALVTYAAGSREIPALLRLIRAR